MADRPALAEIEITPEMVEAGHEVFALCGPDGVVPSDAWLSAVFLAMARRHVCVTDQVG